MINVIALKDGKTEIGQVKKDEIYVYMYDEVLAKDNEIFKEVKF